MGYNLNLNRDRINHFRPKSDPNEGGHIARCGPHILLKFELGEKRNWGKKSQISWFDREREDRRERGKPRLSPKIYGVPLVGFCQAKNESSSHRRGVRLGYLERGISPKFQEGRFQENQSCQV